MWIGVEYFSLRGVAGGDGELGCLCGKACTGHLCDGSAHSSGCVVNGSNVRMLQYIVKSHATLHIFTSFLSSIHRFNQNQFSRGACVLKLKVVCFSLLQVFVVSPSDMVFLPSRVEAAIGSSLSLLLQVRGAITLDNGEQSLEPFSDCRRMSLTITSSEPSIFNVSVDTETGAFLYNSHFSQTVNYIRFASKSFEALSPSNTVVFSQDSVMCFTVSLTPQYRPQFTCTETHTLVSVIR